MWVHSCAHFFYLDKLIILSFWIKNFRRWLDISRDMNVNESIRAREVRLIDANGDQLGVKTRKEALEIAKTRELDLVLVAPNAKPPVCRVMDYGKYRYEQQKKEREARTKLRV